MRLAHHLWRDQSGIYYFRWVVPRDLQASFGKTIIKCSLRIREPGVARAWAYLLGAEYAQLFANARRQIQGGRGMGRSGDPLDDEDDGGASDAILRRLGFSKDQAASWELETPDGLRLRTNGTPEDNASGREALQAYLDSSRLRSNIQRAITPTSHAPTLDEAIRGYGEVEARQLKPNTWSQRSRALAGFAQAIGGHLRVDAITRQMASRWSDGLLRSDHSKAYAANCVSHVAQLFESLVQKGVLHVNPVKGLIVLKKKEKAARRSEGHEWEPFDTQTLQRIFDPQNLARVRTEQVRWGAVIALYTGARVGEIAQLYLRDFVVVDDVNCIRICADSDGQSIKTGESGERLVPVHPDLIELGLIERVKRLRAEGAERLFPAMRIDSAAGKGNAISKGFGYPISRIGR